MAEWLIGIGLVANMAGAGAVFFVAFPQRSVRDSSQVTWGGPPAEELEAEDRHRRFWSLTGLALLFVGFALQLAGLIAQP